VHLLLAVHWLTDPASWPWPDGGGVFGVLGPRAGAATVLALGAAGLPIALVARRRVRSRVLAALAATEALAAGALAADVGVLALLGYACAIVGPAALAVVLLVGALRDRRARLWGAAVVAVVVVGALAGLLTPATASGLARHLWTAFAVRGLEPALRELLLVGAVVWAWAAVLLHRTSTWRCGACGRPGPRWREPEAALRWGRVATWVAVAGPLPYALVRSTWLTPWPVGLPGQHLDPELRLFGLALGAAAVGGAVVTAGLVRPWGEVWPGWVPGLRGRPVPVRFPVVAGGTVAVVLLLATPSLMGIGVQGVRSGDLEHVAFLLLFPTLPWGLALGAAVLSYADRRRGACSTCGLGGPPLSVRP
jgi:hypothetical protein